MAFLKKALAIFNKNKAEGKKVEYIETHLVEQNPETTLSLAKDLLSEVDFSHHGNLEAYVRNLPVPRQIIERWISAGLLFPEEMMMAEKMVKIMLKQEKEQDHPAGRP
jgi:hypothetical protein